MKRLVCEMCGGSDLVKQDGVFVCQNCGTKYSVEEAKKMMVEGAVTVEGTVAVEGTVKVDKTEELKKLYTLARRAKESDNTENACRYYTQIEMQDPDSWEAYFYLIYFKARTSKIGEIPKNCKNFSNCFANALNLLKSSTTDENVLHSSIEMIVKDVALAGEIMASNADIQIGIEDMWSYRCSVYQMMERLGDEIMSAFSEYSDCALHIWESIIETFISIDCFGDTKRQEVNEKRQDYIKWQGYDICNIVEKIYNLNPDYVDPWGTAQDLRRKEKFITCPKCGSKMRERESKCPQCGTPKEEIQRLIKEQEEREAAERERLRKEREAKEAEEARIRAEKRAEWWAANKRKVGIAILILIGIIVSIVAIKKISDAIAAKHAVAEAYEMIEQGKELASTYRFDEAKDLYDQAYRLTENEDVRREVMEKRKELEEVSQAAESEYNNALRRIQILLDADDNEFNEYSNECLDKMIAIHPSARTTQYFQNMFANHPSLTSIQNYEQRGDELFMQAKYEQALKKYKAVEVCAEMNGQSVSEQLKVKIKKCIDNQSLLLDMVGTIGTSQGTLVYDEVKNKGSYEYSLTNASVKRNIVIDRHEGDNLSFTSHDLSGKYIGKFDGTLSTKDNHLSYSGTFTNYKGVSVNFKLTQR